MTFEEKRRAAFELSFRERFKRKGKGWLDAQLRLFPPKWTYSGDVAESHWQTWQAALEWVNKP